MKRLAISVAAVVLVVVGLAAGQRTWKYALHLPGPLVEPLAIVMPHGGTTQLANALAAKGLFAHPALFRIAVWLTRADGALHAGEFGFPAHASIDQVLIVLRTAKPIEHHVTIPEGLTSRQIQNVLAHADAMTGTVGAIEEGSILPETYDYEWGAERDAVVARAKAAMGRALAAAWSDRAPGLPLATPRDALILASIVERETAKPEERPHVAAVYLNRLRTGMKLQADPTVAYAVSEAGGTLDHPLTKADLGRDDPFNTYRSPGLPPAPICSPSADSLQAVVRPAASDDLYFVADGTGGHVFSQTYQAHDAAVARWRALSASTSRPVRMDGNGNGAPPQ